MPTIALLTDFGYADAYVGVMKAVILAGCPDARLLDLTHGIPPHDVAAGALQLASAVPYCAPGTIFLAVVDPGVGGERRPLCLRAENGHLFVGPDNGLLWMAAIRPGANPEAQERPVRTPAPQATFAPQAFHLDRREHWRTNEPSATFQGRDIFAPIAARLASGREPETLGSPISDPVRLEMPRALRRPDGSVRGEVLIIDHFGNAVTNLAPADLRHPAPYSATFQIAGRTLSGPDTHYAARSPGDPVVLLGSLGYYEIAVNGGSAAKTLKLERGAPVAARPTL